VIPKNGFNQFPVEDDDAAQLPLVKARVN